MNTTQGVRHSSNEFAVYPLSRTWKAIREYVERWDRAEGVHFLADRYETFLQFHCGGCAFCLYDHDATLRICAEDADCPCALLEEVRERFAAFLPSRPWGSVSGSARWCD
jgi:hypothetical protein